nr:hypothetical protein Iba_chr11cCG0890 [Ipomoea batatas]
MSRQWHIDTISSQCRTRYHEVEIDTNVDLELSQIRVYKTSHALIAFFLAENGSLAGWFSGECLPHQVQSIQRHLSLLSCETVRPEGHFCSPSSFYLLRCHYLGVLLHYLFRGQGRGGWTSQRRSQGEHGSLQMSIVRDRGGAIIR